MKYIISFIFILNFASNALIGQIVQKNSQDYAAQLRDLTQGTQATIDGQVAQWNTAIAAMNTDVGLLPDADQKSFFIQIAQLQETMQKSASQAKDSLTKESALGEAAIQVLVTQLATDPSNRALVNSINAQLATVSKQYAQIIAQLGRVVSPALAKLQAQIASKVRPIKVTADRQKALKQEQEQLAYRKKMAALIQSLTPAFAVIKDARAASTRALTEFLSQGKIASSTISAVTDSYQGAIAQLSAGYKANGITTDFNDKSNFLSATSKDLIHFYLNVISLMLNKAAKEKSNKSKGAYFQTMFDLTQLMNGAGAGAGTHVVSSGFKSVVQSFASSFFADQSNEVVSYYLSSKKQMTLQAYLDALQLIVTTITDPTEQHVRFAAAYYYEVGTSFGQLDQAQLAAIKKAINSNYALVLVARAHVLLKTMQAGKDNEALMAQVINAYAQAATYFNQAPDQANAQQFQALSDGLKNAMKMRAQAINAQASNNTDLAIQSFSQALQGFVQAGDTVYSQEVQKRLTTLQAQQAQSKAVALIAGYVVANKSQFQAYEQTLADPTTPAQSNIFEALLLELSTVSGQAIDQFNVAIEKLQETNAPAADLQAAVGILYSIIKVQPYIVSGDQAARSGTVDGLNAAQNNDFNNALLLFTQIDERYKANQALKLLAPLPQLIQMDFFTLLQRHIAKLYADEAQLITNDLPALSQYYTYALSGRKSYLPTAIVDFLTAKITELGNQTAQVNEILKAAQQKENEALRLPADAWKAVDSKATLYRSPADDAWKDILRSYLTAHQLGSSDGLAGYIRSIQEYLVAYRQNVIDSFAPLGAATIAYRLYVLDKVANDLPTSQAVMKEIEKIVSPFFATMQKLNQEINAVGQLAQAPDNQNALIGMLNRFDQLLNDQQSIASELAPSADPKTISLFAKSIDQAGAITVTMKEPNQSPLISFAAANPDLSFANLYKKLGDYYFDRKEYNNAAKAYKNAINYFNKVNQTQTATQLNAQYQLAYTRSLVDAYLSLIIPNAKDAAGIAMVPVVGTSVPDRYLLYSYVQEIPDYIPFGLSAAQIQQLSPDALSQQLLNYAFLLFANNSFKDAAIQFTDVFNGVQLRNPINLSADQKKVVDTILDNAARYATDLKNRIAAQKSSLRLSQRVNNLGKTVFDLYELYKPIPVFTIPGIMMMQLPYRAYPTTQFYYGWARQLSDPSVSLIANTYVSGNDPDRFKQITILMAQAYLSAALQYKKRIDFLRNGGDLSAIDPLMSAQEFAALTAARADIQKLQKIDKNDVNVKIDDFKNTYQLMQQYILTVITSCYSLASSLYEQLNDTQKVAAIAQVINVDLPELMGECAELFLVGDPRQADYFWGSQSTYGGILIDMKNYYLMAATSAGKASALSATLITRAAQQFVRAGDILINQKNYFGATTFYTFAVGAFKSLPTINQQQLTDATLKLLSSYYVGASQNIIGYQTARKAPVTLTLSNGQQVTNDLLSMIASKDITDSVQSSLVKKLQNDFLDAMIYYNRGSEAVNIIVPVSNAQPSTSNQTTPSVDPLQVAMEKIINDYLKQNNLSLATIDEIIAWVQSDNFQKQLLGAFDYFKQKIVAAGGDADRTIAYKALSSWMFRLYYPIFSSLYLHDFWPTAGDKAADILQQDIANEEQNILAPAEQWIG